MQNVPPHLGTSGCFFLCYSGNSGDPVLGEVKASVAVLDTFQNFVLFLFSFFFFPPLMRLGKPVFSLQEPQLFCSFVTPVQSKNKYLREILGNFNSFSNVGFTFTIWKRNI